LIPLELVHAAHGRIRAHVQRTPLTWDAPRRLWIKWENRQPTGSFKVRGAFNKILTLPPEELGRGIVCASAGNHGQAVALAAAGLAPVEIFVGENASPMKVARMRALGAAIHVIPGGYSEAETAAREYAESNSRTWISPYNDPAIIAGQGTLGMELLEQLASEPVEAFVVPVGGGGLISGIGTVLWDGRPRPRLVGVQPADNAFMHALFVRGTQAHVRDLPSLADGLTGAVQDTSVTIELIRQLVDEIILVSEDEIARAIAFAWSAYHEVIEGSGAVSLAALLTGRVAGRPAVAVVTGGNIDPAVHTRILDEYGSQEPA